MTLPAAKQDPHLRRYALRRHRLSVAGGTLSIVCPRARGDRRIAEANVRAAESGDEPPYWAQVWPASVALARALLREARSGGIRGTHVVDLGCGVGVAGAGAALAGARVTSLDKDADAVRFARFNAEQNGAAAVEARVFDWHRDPVPEGVDHLLLADVSYRRRHHGPLLEIAGRVLDGGGQVWHVDPMRPAADAFVDQLRASAAVDEQALAAHLEGQTISVRLVRAGRPGSGPTAG